MPAQVVLAGGENDPRALDPAAVNQNRAPHARSRAHIRTPMPVRTSAPQRWPARGGRGRGAARRPRPAAGSRTGLRPGAQIWARLSGRRPSPEGSEAELSTPPPQRRSGIRRRPAGAAPPGVRTHDLQSARGQPRGGRRAGRITADHQHVRAFRHGALIRPTAYRKGKRQLTVVGGPATPASASRRSQSARTQDRATETAAS